MPRSRRQPHQEEGQRMGGYMGMKLGTPHAGHAHPAATPAHARVGDKVGVELGRTKSEQQRQEDITRTLFEVG